MTVWKYLPKWTQNVNFHFTYEIVLFLCVLIELSLRTRGLLVQLRVAQFVKKYLAFHRAGKFTVFFTRRSQLVQSCARWSPSAFSSHIMTIVISSHLLLVLPSGFLLSYSPIQMLCAFISSPMRGIFSTLPVFFSFLKSNSLWWRVQIMQFL